MADGTIYHNPGCSKSRGALEILRERGALFHEDLAQLAQMHRDLEACFPAGSIDLVTVTSASRS